MTTPIRRRRRILPYLLLLILLAACSQPAAAPAIEVTRVVEQPVTVEVTRVVEATRLVEVTRETIVTAAPPPATLAPTAAPVASVARIVDDRDQTQDRGGVTVTVKGAGLLDWAQARQQPDMLELAALPAFEDTTVLGAITVVVTNTTAGKVNIYPEQGTVVVGPEQIDLTAFMLYSENIGGTLFSGVTNEGTLLFGLERQTWEQLAAGAVLIYEINAPTAEDYTALGEPYRFELTLQPE